ncbi:MAG: YihY/virulence factor BrkB family protein [Acidobacteriaceae bacterium]
MAAESAWKLGGLTVRELGKRVWREFNEDEILDRSAALSYYFIGAIFPLLFVLFSILGLLASPGSQLRQSIMQHAAMVLPGSASTLVDKTLNEIMKASGGGKISFGIILSIWSASAGVAAVMSALNVVYDIRETRNYFRGRFTAIWLMFAMTICITLGLAIALFGGTAAEWVGNRMNLAGALVLTWKIVQWVIVVFAMSLAFAVLYYFGPNLRDQKWEWVTPGSLVGFLLWLGASLGFKLYVNSFSSYSATYGSLGVVIILLLWFYVTGISLLLGAEVNSEIEHAAADHGDREAKKRGEVAPGVFLPRHGLVRPTHPEDKKKEEEQRPAA